MKIPITGNPEVDAQVVKAAIAALEARERAEAGASDLRQRVDALRGWVRRKRGTLTREVRKVLTKTKQALSTLGAP